jgi:hypothetical protein
MFLTGQVAGEGRHSFQVSIWVGLLYAVAGELVTLAVTLYVHPAYLHDSPGPSRTPLPSVSPTR